MDIHIRTLFRPKSKIELLLEESKRCNLLEQPVRHPSIHCNLGRESAEQQYKRELERKHAKTQIINKMGELSKIYRYDLSVVHRERRWEMERNRRFGECWASFDLPRIVGIHAIIEPIKMPNECQLGLTSMQIVNLGLTDYHGKIYDVTVKHHFDEVRTSVYNIDHEYTTNRSILNYPTDKTDVLISRELAKALDMDNSSLTLISIQKICKPGDL